jgi:hypothetical protein
VQSDNTHVQISANRHAVKYNKLVMFSVYKLDLGNNSCRRLFRVHHVAASESMCELSFLPAACTLLGMTSTGWQQTPVDAAAAAANAASRV